MPKTKTVDYRKNPENLKIGDWVRQNPEVLGCYGPATFKGNPEGKGNEGLERAKFPLGAPKKEQQICKVVVFELTNDPKVIANLKRLTGLRAAPLSDDPATTPGLLVKALCKDWGDQYVTHNPGDCLRHTKNRGKLRQEYILGQLNRDSQPWTHMRYLLGKDEDDNDISTTPQNLSTCVGWVYLAGYTLLELHGDDRAVDGDGGKVLVRLAFDEKGRHG
jgi:hypothetical protein